MVIYKKSYRKRVLKCPECGCVFDASDDKDIHILTYNQKVCIKCPECRHLLVVDGVDKSKLYETFGVYIPKDQEPCE